MNWILKNKNSSCEIPPSRSFAFGKNGLQDEKKKKRRKKTLLAVLFLACIFFMAAHVAHAGYLTSTVGDGFVQAAGYLLTGVQSAVGKLFAIAASLFATVINPDNISGPNGILNKQAVKDVWIMVRDTLNMAFILVLLFSAFCTIFQVEKWSLKKVWLSILINALLVNFSFAIARFFIDVSNVAMYYFVNNMFTATGTVTGNSIFASLGAASGISGILQPANYSADGIAYQIMMIIFTFIFGMTLLIIAVLFVIRLIALAMLIMFAPIGFVGYIFPDTHHYADEWWKKLFSYSFFGPIMIFMIAIALRVAQTINNENFSSFRASAGVNSANDQASWIANAAFYSIPIVILWMGLGYAQSAGGVGADTIVKTGKKWGKAVANFPLKASGISGGVKLGWENYRKKGVLFGTNKMDERASKIGRLLGDKHAVNDNQSKRVKEASDHHDMANMTDPALSDLKKHGNQYYKAAATLELANRGKAKTEDVEEIKKQFGDNSRVFSQVRNKVKTYDPVAAFAAGVDLAGKIIFDKDGLTRMQEHIASNQFDSKKVNANSWKNEAFQELAFTKGGVGNEDMEAVLKKNPTDAKEIKNVISIVADKHTDDNNDIDKAIQLTHLAQVGKLSPEGGKNPLIRKFVFSKLDGKTGANIESKTVDAHAREILDNIKPGKLIDFVKNIKDVAAQKELLTEIRNRAVDKSDPVQHKIYQKHAAALIKDASTTGAYASV